MRLLREFDRRGAPDLDVPDPYYGGDRGFENVLDMVEARLPRAARRAARRRRV